MTRMHEERSAEDTGLNRELPRGYGASATRGRPWLSALLLVLLGAVLTPSLRAGSGGDDALYWRIRDAGGETAGFLLGTIHSEDPRVVDFPQSLIDQLASCDTFAMEMVPDLPTLTRLTDYMHYPQDGVLLQRLGQARYERVMAALAAYQVPDDWKSRMKIWAVLMTLSVPPPRTGFFMDLSLSLRAAGGGLDVTGLETLEQQLAFLENMPLDFQLQLLDQALAEYSHVAEVHRQMVDTYLTGSLEALARLTDAQFEQLDEPVRRYFVGQGIVARNRRMVGSLRLLLQDARVFVAVGALHLPGEAGLLAMLRADGYRLEPLPNPFARQAAIAATGPADG